MGNIPNGIDDLIDLTRTFTQQLHLSRCSLYIFVDTSHARNCLLYRITSILCILVGITSNGIEHLRSFSHLATRTRHMFYLDCHCGNLLDLPIATLHQLHHTVKNQLCRVFYLVRYHLHSHHKASQFFHHIVKRVSQHSQSISLHLSLHPQITFTHTAHLTHQFLHLG